MQLVIEDAEQVDHISLWTGPLSDEQFWDLCAKYPDYDVEVSAEGEAIIMAPVGGWTGVRNSKITRQLDVWAEEDGRGVACDSSTMFVLPNGARRSPDASWVSNERLPYNKEGSWLLCPDFVIELRSQSDRGLNLRRKMREWMENGAKLGWLVEPKSRTVVVYRPGREPETLVSPDRVLGEGPVDGFTLELNKIWESSIRRG